MCCHDFFVTTGASSFFFSPTKLSLCSTCASLSDSASFPHLLGMTRLCTPLALGVSLACYQLLHPSSCSRPLRSSQTKEIAVAVQWRSVLNNDDFIFRAPSSCMPELTVFRGAQSVSTSRGGGSVSQSLVCHWRGCDQYPSSVAPSVTPNQLVFLLLSKSF